MIYFTYKKPQQLFFPSLEALRRDNYGNINICECVSINAYIHTCAHSHTFSYRNLKDNESDSRIPTEQHRPTSKGKECL